MVFVPYRGFYFLNCRIYEDLYNLNGFSSPIGAFIFLIRSGSRIQHHSKWFSSPIGAFIFLIHTAITHHVYTFLVFVPYRGFYFLNSSSCFQKEKQLPVFVPYRGFYFLNPGLTILVFMRVKKMFCGVNLF